MTTSALQQYKDIVVRRTQQFVDIVSKAGQRNFDLAGWFSLLSWARLKLYPSFEPSWANRNSFDIMGDLAYASFHRNFLTFLLINVLSHKGLTGAFSCWRKVLNPRPSNSWTSRDNLYCTSIQGLVESPDSSFFKHTRMLRDDTMDSRIYRFPTWKE